MSTPDSDFLDQQHQDELQISNAARVDAGVLYWKCRDGIWSGSRGSSVLDSRALAIEDRLRSDLGIVQRVHPLSL